MKYKTTKKAVNDGYTKKIIFGYCEGHYLLKGCDPIGYTCGVYGWNADIYHINWNTAIITGFRPFGNIKPNYKLLEDYNERARQEQEKAKSWTEAKNKTNELLNEFVNICLGLEDSQQ